MSSIFGGSSSKNSSSNLAFNSLNTALSPAVSTGAAALSNEAGQLGSFGAYKKNAGFDFAQNQGERQLSGGAAANGILNSGETGKAIANYDANLGNTYYQNYLGDLGQVAQTGISAANPIAAAGQVSSGSSSATNGAASVLGWL